MYPDQVPAPEQPPIAPVQSTPPHYSAPAPATDPGKTLGIVGFILAFLVSIAGIIVSIIGLMKSRKAGFKNPLALAGIIVGGVFTLATIALIAVTVVAYNGVQNRANTSNAKSTANMVAKQVEAYNILRDDASYPKQLSQISNISSSDFTFNVPDTQATRPLSSAPVNPDTFEFYACEEEGFNAGNKIGYWDYTVNKVTYIYTGSASSDSTCTFSAS